MKIARLSFPVSTQGPIITVEDVDLTPDELKTLSETINNVVHPPSPPIPVVSAIPYGTVDCEYKEKCIDKYSQCGTCENNKAQSYYKERD